jgi:dTDP-glucose pyrophosphorylase
MKMNYDYKKHLIESHAVIKTALKMLNSLGADAILFIVDGNNSIIGSLTDGDVRRGLLKGLTLDSEVDEFIQPTPKFIRRGDYNLQQIIDYRENNYKVLPVVDHNNVVVNIINFRFLRSYLPVDAVIMAGGRGARLKPYTDTIPKPMLKVGDKPIIEHNLDRLSLYGIDDFWVSVKYLGEQIEQHFGNGADRNLRINYVWENEARGTIGSVAQIENFEHKYILVTNSDLLTNLDYEHFFMDFINQDADFSVVTIPYEVKVPYAVLETSNGQVVSFKEKPTYTYYSNGGIYLMKRDVVNHIPLNEFYNATDLMEALIKKGMKVISYPLRGYWLDIGKHDDYKKAQTDINYIKF